MTYFSYHFAEAFIIDDNIRMALFDYHPTEDFFMNLFKELNVNSKFLNKYCMDDSKDCTDLLIKSLMETNNFLQELKANGTGWKWGDVHH